MSLSGPQSITYLEVIEMPEKLKSRKLWFFVVLGMLFTAMQINGYLPVDAQAYSTLMFGVMVGYAGGNVGEHFANR